MRNHDHIVRGQTTPGTNTGSFAPHHKTEADPGATLTVDDYVDADQIAWARETLGTSATDDAVLELAYQRAQVAHAENHPATYSPPPLTAAECERILFDTGATDLARPVLDRPAPHALGHGDEVVLFGFPPGQHPTTGTPEILHGVVDEITTPDPYSVMTIRFTDGRTVTAKSYAKCARLAFGDQAFSDDNPYQVANLVTQLRANVDQAKQARRCLCATNDDGTTTTTMLCPEHAEVDPCLTMAQTTGRRRTGTIRNGRCTHCGHRS